VDGGGGGGTVASTVGEGSYGSVPRGQDRAGPACAATGKGCRAMPDHAGGWQLPPLYCRPAALRAWLGS